MSESILALNCFSIRFNWYVAHKQTIIITIIVCKISGVNRDINQIESWLGVENEQVQQNKLSDDAFQTIVLI